VAKVPAVSVVLPVKEAPLPYLSAAVASVLEQTLPDLELLIVEVPSARPASAALEDIRDSRLTHHVLDARTTMVEQLNFGLAQSRAPLVARMDADDVCDRDRLRVQLAYLEGHPEVAVVGTQIELIDARGEALGRRRFPLEHDEILRALRRKNPISHPSVVFRREVVLDAGGYLHSERPAQDYDLWCRLAVGGVRFGNLDRALLRYRLHADSVKMRRLRETLRTTILIKETYWRGRMNSLDRLRLLAEKTALLLPAPLVYGFFRWVEYGVRPARARSSR
jgi:glycosyltransferase involved in cell wall biosynthesis